MDKGQLRDKARSILDAVADSTASEYQRANERLQGQHWRDYATDRSLGRRSAAVLKAGWRHARARAVLDGLRQSDRAKKAGDDGAARAARAAAEEAYQALERDEAAGAYQPPAGEQRGVGSKRRHLPRSSNWQARIISELKSPSDRVTAAVLAATGCRPSELERGVSLDLEGEGDSARVVAHIAGSKQSEKLDSGQAWRELSIPADGSASTALLRDHLERSGGAAVVAGCSDAFRKRLQRAGSRAGWRGISPYSFRHQFASDEKSAGNDDAVSAALGHASARSKQNYGHANQARGRGGVSVKAARQPRHGPDQAPAPAPGPSPG